MAMTPEDIFALFDSTVVDSDGTDIGSVGQVFLDAETEEPAWITVRTGLFGIRETFVPLQDAEWVDSTVRVPYTKQFMVDAPTVSEVADGVDGAASADENPYEYYGIDPSSAGLSKHARNE